MRGKDISAYKVTPYVLFVENGEVSLILLIPETWESIMSTTLITTLVPIVIYWSYGKRSEVR